jgi:sterol desaturase/sphingolipid hydroxylase (fatty acid hydroxylase superfamily)
VTVDLAALLLAAGTSLVFLCAVFVPLERAFPARAGQPFFRRGFATDLAFFLGQYLLWNGAVLGLLTLASTGLGLRGPHALRTAFLSHETWLQVAEVVLASDLLVYWGHRLQHRVGFLWRFHAVHHSAQRLDWLAAHREHPLDTVYTLTLINLPAMAVGFPVASVAGLVAFRGLWAIYIHSNVRLPLPRLRAVIGSPELHHQHHALDRDAGNYANVSPLMDVLFGTYRVPVEEPAAFGVREPFPETYLGQLLHPFRRRPRAAPVASVPPGTPVRPGGTTPPRPRGEVAEWPNAPAC